MADKVTYVPGYGYVHSNDPGTSGSVKKGNKPVYTGQEPAGSPTPDTPFIPPVVVPPVNLPEDVAVGNSLNAGAPFQWAGDAANGLFGERGATPNTSLENERAIQAQLSAAYGQTNFASKDSAQRVADINDGYVVEESPGVFKVVYGIYALQAEAVDAQKRKTTPSNYVNLPEDRMAGTPSNYRNLPEDQNYLDPASDGGRYGSTFSTDPTAYAPQYTIRESMFSQQPPTAPMTMSELVTARQKNDPRAYLVYMGEVATAGSTGTVTVDNLQDVRFVSDYNNLNPDQQKRIIDMVAQYYSGMPWQFAWIDKRWRAAVASASQTMLTTGERVDPFSVYNKMIATEAAWNAENRASGGSGGGGGGYYGGGGYGGGGGGSATIRLTSRTDAMVILNQAMQQFLGRKASIEELNKFVKVLNSQEQANPITQEYSGNSVVQSGGFNAQAFAEQFAQAQDGSAEYQSATTYLNALMSILDGNTGVL